MECDDSKACTILKKNDNDRATTNKSETREENKRQRKIERIIWWVKERRRSESVRDSRRETKGGRELTIKHMEMEDMQSYIIT